MQPITRHLVPQNVIGNLRELQALTSDSGGAQRVAWTETWQKARAWLHKKLESLPVEADVDEAGNSWAVLRGKSSRSLVLGSHIDSVPNGGWLDGALGVVAGLEVLRRFASEGEPPVTVRLVSWADEEGARFAYSLFGSAAACGTMDADELRGHVDQDGVGMADALTAYDVDLNRAKKSGSRLENTAAYLELHIEQGPVLESRNLPLGVVIGTQGIERHAVRFTGQAAHAGSTPMNMRRDALAAAARLELAIREIAVQNNGVCTMGSVVTHPGIATAVAGQCDVLLDQRSLDAAGLARMLSEAKAASYQFADEEGVTAAWKRLYQIEPIFFTPELVDLCARAVQETGCEVYRMPSGPLHDASNISRAGIPTAMLFVQSLQGLSHTREEDTLDEHLLLSVEALDRLADLAIEWILRC